MHIITCLPKHVLSAANNTKSLNLRIFPGKYIHSINSVNNIFLFNFSLSQDFFSHKYSSPHLGHAITAENKYTCAYNRIIPNSLLPSFFLKSTLTSRNVHYHSENI